MHTTGTALPGLFCVVNRLILMHIRVVDRSKEGFFIRTLSGAPVCLRPRRVGIPHGAMVLYYPYREQL